MLYRTTLSRAFVAAGSSGGLGFITSGQHPAFHVLHCAGPEGCPLPGKIVRFDDETSALIDLLRRERRRSFQQLADEAFNDLLEKHGRPPKLADQLQGSLDEAPKRRRKKPR